MAHTTISSPGKLWLALVATAVLLISGYFVKHSFEVAKDAQELLEAVDKTVENALETAEKTETKTRTAHGNSDNNCDLHKVYEIYTEDVWGAHSTLKYGITSQCDFKTKDGNPRPEYQIRAYQLLPEYRTYIVKYCFLNENIEGRIEAKLLEQFYVDEYYIKFGTKPPEQQRPFPKCLKNK